VTGIKATTICGLVLGWLVAGAGGLVAQVECPPDFDHFEDNFQPFWLPQTTSMVTPGVIVPGTCPNEPCRFSAFVSVNIWTPNGPDVIVQVCQTTTATTACGYFPIPFDPARPVHTQHAEGNVEWALKCGEELKQDLQMWDGVLWITFVHVEMTCGGCGGV
jgi:hypothetical protein